MNSSEPHGVTLLSWSLDEPAALVETLFELLDEVERRRANTLTREVARRRFVVSRGRLRQRLGECLGLEARDVAFRYGPAGKPEVAGDSALQFNLAHSDELAICVTNEKPVGIDLERVRPMKNAMALAQRWFHPAEVERIAAAPDSLAEFFRTWTMKEAALKLIGVGVGESLPHVLTPDALAGGIATGLPENAIGLKSCRVEPIECESNFAAALAFPEH